MLVEDDELELRRADARAAAAARRREPASSDELKTEQVHRLEPEAVKTTEHPRLPPPIVEDEIDTQRVTRADVNEIVAAEETRGGARASPTIRT